MIIYVTPPDGRIIELTWPDGWRIPAAGELLLIAADTYTVVVVQWELDQGNDPAVQLRVV